MTPRLLPRPQAAEYCGMTQQAFMFRVRRKELPPPTFNSKPPVWDREALDRTIDRINGIHREQDDAEAQALEALRG